MGYAMMTRSMSYGYYGKLPFAGDFLRRGLSTEVVTAWDSWLQKTMIAGREELGDEHWTMSYFSAPIWRFSIAPGLCGSRGMAGILMPSLDSVGRRFPFCIAAETDLPPVAANLALQPVVERLEAAALEMIEVGASQERLVTLLSALPPMAAVDPDIGPRHGSLWVAAGTDQPRVLNLPAMPTGPAEAAALFDIEAPFWLTPREPAFLPETFT